MASILGKKKSRTRTGSISERSIPYDQLAQPPRSPLPVGTTSQGLATYISAPITNPTLTTNGAEINKHTVARSRAERDKVYTDSRNRASSPSASLSTTDSSTLNNESSSTRPNSKQKRLRRSEASTSSSHNFADFGHYPASPSNRPMSSRSDANRGSKYAPSFTSDSHLSQFYHHVNGKAHDDFHFERPTNDADIEAMFESVVRNRDLGDLSMLSIDQKWHMVYNDEHIRRNEERTREDNSRKQVESGHASIVEGSPEWYIQKFMNRTVTPKQAGALQVCLRSRELRCLSQSYY
jgi:cytokinesis protein